MITDHDLFCLSHACGEQYRGEHHYCPYADRIREKYGYILPSACKERIEEIEHPETQNGPGSSNAVIWSKRKNGTKSKRTMVPDDAYRIDI